MHRQRLATRVRHDDVRDAIDFAGSEDPHDVRMLELGDGENLASKACCRHFVKQYCSTCHLAAPEYLNFSSRENFEQNKFLIKAAVCNAHTMPHSELQYKAFWTKDTGPVYLPGLLAATLNWPGKTPGAPPSCP